MMKRHGKFQMLETRKEIFNIEKLLGLTKLLKFRAKFIQKVEYYFRNGYFSKSII